MTLLRTLRLFLLLLAGTTLFVVNAWSQTFTGQRIPLKNEALNQRIYHWEAYRIDVNAIDQLVRQQISTTFTLDLGEHHWPLTVTPNDLYGPDYQLQTVDAQGIKTKVDRIAPLPLEGRELTSNGWVRITTNQDFMCGIIAPGAEQWYIEPLKYTDPTADADVFVVYERKQVKRDVDATCTTVDNLEMIGTDHDDEHDQNQPESFMGCYQVDLAIASDNSMLIKYGSVTAVENHNVAVINSVEVDYTGVFTHDIKFNIVIQIVSSTNPWNPNADAGTYLGNFRAWGNGGGFGVPYDLAECWTNIDFNGSTIGIAYLNGLCTSNKYHCLQDFSSNSELLRCMTSHEIGHNFSCQHDGTGTCPPNYIMCPFVSTANEWSNTSISSVNSFLPSRINANCLTACVTGPPPVPEFSWTPEPGCVNQQVNFTNESTGTINTYNWQFPGGSPSSSTQINPTVVWTTPGIKNVTLTLNIGTATQATLTKQVTILGLTTANFTSSVNGLYVTFTNLSTNATAYEWDFGDGTGSFEENPIHEYIDGGIYVVKLTATGPCGTATKTLTVNTAPTADFEGQPASGCPPLAVGFTNLSSPNAVSFAWSFPGGSPATSTANNPTVVYFTPGTYSVTLTAFNAVGSATMTKTNYVVVSGLPGTGFNYSASGLTVTFTNTTTNATSYSWNFGDGNTSTLTNPVHTYAVGGVYTVTLTATNACGTKQEVKTVTLLSPPSTSFTATPTSGCGPLTVQYTNTSGNNPTSFAWQFPGGTPATSSQENPLVVYNTPGTYSVTLTATNAAGSNTATQTNLIVVSGPPSPSFTSAINGMQASFTNTTAVSLAPVSNNTFLWNFGDPASGSNNTSTLENPTHTFSALGTYTVTLTVTNSCGSNTTTQTVNIIAAPTASFTATPTTGCNQLTVQFSNTSAGNPTSLAWQFPGGMPSSSSDPNPVVVYAAPGNYTVILTASNAAGSGSVTQTNLVTVATNPVAAFTGAVNGATATFTNNSSGATSYSWNFGDNTTSTNANPTHTYTADGTYTVVLTSTNNCGTATSTQTVTIITPPTAGFTANGPTTGCAPFTVTFNNTSSANAATFEWSFPGGNPATSTAANPTVVYATAGVYSVTLVASNGGGSSTATQTSLITVGTTPTPAFSAAVAGATATFTNTSSGATAYSWNFGDNTSSADANPTHTYTADGTYTVVLTATNNCGTSTSTQTVTIVTPPTASFSTNGPASGCAPFTVTFNNTSSANATSYLWQFPGGMPATSSEQNPTVVYSAAGTYNVVLTAYNNAGSATATQTNYVTVGVAPGAAFSGTNNGAIATFSNTSTSATAYSWNFGDGGTSAATNPTHTYSTDGTYTVTLTATNNCGTSTATQTLTIVTQPLANFIVTGSTVGCAPFSVTFTNLSSANATSLLWVFPGGDPTSSTEANPTVVYSAPGTYSVTLNASNSAGVSTVTQTNYIVVGGIPTTVFASQVSGSEVTFLNGTVNATGYSWNFGDNNTSTDPNPVHTYAADGTYTITLTATNSCGSSTYTETVTILTPPVAGFSATNNIGCSPLTVQFTSTSSANTNNLLWQFPGGTPSASMDPNPVVTYNNPGVYNVTLTASNSAGSNSDIQNSFVVVNTVPQAGFTVQTAGLGVVLTNTSSNATGYFWDFGDSNTSTEANPTHNYAQTGTYMVSLKAFNDCGNQTFTQEVVISGSAPLPLFSIGEDSTGCAPFNAVFTDLSAGNPTAWNWEFEGGQPAFSAQQNPSVTYSQPGIFNVTLTVTNAFGSASATQTVYVQSAPATADFTYVVTGADVAFSSVASGNVNYLWNFGDGTTSNEANPNHTYTTSGDYVVQLTVSNECGEINSTQTVSVEVSGAGDLSWLKGLRVFPNPNTGNFTLELTGATQDEVLATLENALGQTISQTILPLSNGQLVHQFNHADLSSGMYTLRLRSGQHSAAVKVMVAK